MSSLALAQYLLRTVAVQENTSVGNKGSNEVLRLIHSKSMTLATVDLDGKLIGPWVDEVRTTVAGLQRGQKVCLNLQHLSYADAAGLELLCRMRSDGILLVGASPLIDGLLQLHGGQAARSVDVEELR